MKHLPKRRPKQFIWVTWLAKVLAEEKKCRQRRRLRIDGLEASGDSGRDQGGTRTIDHAQVLPAARRVRGRVQHRSGVFSTYGKPEQDQRKT